MIEIIEEWFEQGFNPMTVLVYLIMALLGVFINHNTQTKRGKLIAIGVLIILILTTIFGFGIHNYMHEIMSILIGGIAITVLIGMIIGIIIEWIRGKIKCGRK